jgi:hypothetical protein
MEFSDALRQVVEDHVARHGIASLWGTPGFYEVLAADETWNNAAVELLNAEDGESDDGEDEDSASELHTQITRQEEFRS